MADKKQNLDNVEREYVIPLREKVRAVPRYKRTPKAVKTIKEFLVRHMRVRDRDLKKVKIDKHLNELLWFRGIKRPPHKIKVKAIKEGEIVRVEAVELIDRIKFKKIREEKFEKHALDVLEKKKTMMQKAKESLQTKPSKEESKEESEEDKKKEAEKRKAGTEASAKQAKAQAKQTKHQAGGKAKQKTAPVRKALGR